MNDVWFHLRHNGVELSLQPARRLSMPLEQARAMFRQLSTHGGSLTVTANDGEPLITLHGLFFRDGECSTNPVPSWATKQ